MFVRATKRGIPDSVESESAARTKTSDHTIELNLARTIQDQTQTIVFILGGLIFVFVVGFTWKQALLGIAVDTFALAVALKLQPFFVGRWTPQFKAVFPQFLLSEREGRMLSESARVELFKLLRSWPYERAKNAFVLSLLKAIPVSILALFFFDRVFSWPIHASLYLAVEFLFLLDFSFLCYVQAHEDVSRFFKQVHQRDDWSTTFERVGYDEGDVRQFQKVESIAFWGVLILTILGVATVSVGRKWDSEWAMLGSLVLIVALGAGFLAQLVSVHRRFLVSGLVEIIRSFGTLETGTNRRLIALSSWSLFAGFETAFNRLVRRLDRREREVGQLMNRFAEESRLLTLGEVSGLVVHDLGNTLQIAQFAAESLGRCQDPMIEKKLKDELQASLDRLGALVSTLRARLEGRGTAHAGTPVGTTQAHVGRFLELQFKEASFLRSTWLHLDARIHRVFVSVPQAELFQVLENLLRNSVQSVLRAQRADPRIGIRVIDGAPSGFVFLEVSDNGVGLSEERFNQLTEGPSQQESGSRVERGLGLRLTRRIVEQFGGSLKVVPSSGSPTSDSASVGVRLLLCLPGEIREPDAQVSLEV